MFNYKHVISFKENDGTTRNSLPNTVHTRDLAEYYLLKQCCKKCNAVRHGLPRLNIINDDMIKEILTPKPASFFEEFQNDFYKSIYSKQPKLGEMRNCKSKPEHINNISTTFGDSSKVEEPLYPLVLPNKKPNEVIREYYDAHEQYIKSHNSYFAAEQIRRKYKPPFSKDKCYGMAINVPKNGEQLAQTLVTCKERFFVRTNHMNFMRAHEAFLGEKHQRGEPVLPYGSTYGIDTFDKDFCNMKCILEDLDPTKPVSEPDKPKIVEAIAYINKLRFSLMNSPNRRIYDLLLLLKRKDENGTGFLRLDDIFEVIIDEYKLRVEEMKIKTALKYYNLIEGDLSNDSLCSIEAFWKFLHLNFQLPEGRSLSGPPIFLTKETSYTEAFGNVAPNRYVTPVGPIINEVQVNKLNPPDIYCQFDLNEKDFEELLTKDKLKRIFGTILQEPELFNKVWEAAKIKHNRNNDLVSVKDMRSVLQEFVLKS